MPRFSKSVRVPYSKLQAFNLVSDIASYPDFIKWITAMRVSEVRTDEAGIRHSRGDAVVGFKGFVERFATSVVADPLAGTVVASLIKGPFRRLHAQWSIIPLERGGTDIALEIDYEFRNVLIAMLAAANHDIAVDRIMSAFLVEAQNRYGQAPIASAPE
ncbi:type II toxin-antitoxin system RatA family toxin [Hyphomonas sp.]|uniref:type II toxin-antitoxin system RatA family toxin n=1 Tax=Hyphomonas sp. TaxID=87 RepID=UPI0032ED58B1|tara:strand:+ start:167 stop:643 length:477 start_codon:yes stop_codon:yes gene_type:complete